MKPKIEYHRHVDDKATIEGRLQVFILTEDGWGPLVLAKAAKVGFKPGKALQESKKQITRTIWASLVQHMKEGSVPSGKSYKKVLAWAFTDPRVVHP